VYRRRRLAVLLLLIVVVGVIWLLIAQPWRGEATVAPTPTVSASTPSPTPSVSTSAGPDTAEDAETAASATPPPADTLPECTEADVTVEAVTDQATYAADQNPQFSIRLTNTGEDCAMNVGTTTQSFIVTSGTETYWRSTDCQTEPSDMIVTIAAGQTVTSAAPVVWDRTRSSVDSCDGARSSAPGGGASYHLAVAIGGITSATTAQFLLY
jgi:cytoskeletal protein RodZ